MKILEQFKIENEELEARMAFVPGLKLYGYCNGIFGRNSYGVKTILAIEEDFITVKEEDKNATNCATVSSWLDLLNSSNRACRELNFEGD